MKLYDNDAYREEFMALVYGLLMSDRTNDRANQIISAFDMAPAVEAELLLPNEPLTLEELREMDGDPIWIVHTDYTLFGKEYWGIVRDGFSGLPNCFVATRHGNVRLLYSEYGKTWLAYRRKPEAATPKANPDWCDHIKRRFEKVT